MSENVEKPTTQQITRMVIRKWIEVHARTLETAQAEGKLARVKLDLRDKIQAEFPPGETSPDSHLMSMFSEELEAFCADMRLATVTVQTQVERKKKGSLGFFRSALIFITVFVVVLFLAIAIINGGN